MANNLKEKLKYLITSPICKFFLPFVLAIFGIVILQFSLRLIGQAGGSAKLLFLMVAYFFPPLGKESVIPIGVAGGKITVPFSNQIVEISAINPFIMAMAIAFVDIMVALFLVWNYDLAKKIPIVGGFMEKIEKVGKKSSSKYSWVRGLRFVGIALFVMIPFQGSGGLVSSILGRLVGMKPWNTFAAISVGAISGCLLIAYFADFVKSVFIQNFLYGLLIVILLLTIGVMIWVYRNSKNNKNKKED